MKSNSEFNLDTIDTKNTINYKYCEFCGAPIPRGLESNCCDKCRERVLFQEVKEYIRANDVNEFQVAAHFNIPLRMVKAWIQEGRIEYKTVPEGKRTLNSNLRCEKCGAPVTFGTLCTKCLRSLTKNIHGYDMQLANEDGKMHFLDTPVNKKE